MERPLDLLCGSARETFRPRRGPRRTRERIRLTTSAPSAPAVAERAAIVCRAGQVVEESTLKICHDVFREVATLTHGTPRSGHADSPRYRVTRRASARVPARPARATGRPKGFGARDQHRTRHHADRTGRRGRQSRRPLSSSRSSAAASFSSAACLAARSSAISARAASSSRAVLSTSRRHRHACLRGTISSEGCVSGGGGTDSCIVTG